MDGMTSRRVSFSLQVEEATMNDKILLDNHHHGMCDSLNSEMDRSETIFAAAGEGVHDCCFFLPLIGGFPVPLPRPRTIYLNYMIRAFDRGHSTLRAHFSLGIGKFDTLPNPLLTLDDKCTG